MYKLWLQVERQPARGECENVGEPLELGVFDTRRAAERAALKLHQAAWPDCPGPECAPPLVRSARGAESDEEYLGNTLKHITPDEAVALLAGIDADDEAWRKEEEERAKGKP